MSVIERLNAALEGRYTLLREIGEGGMATVYLAEDVRHNRKVALKVLKPELAAVVGSERFLAEIETTANLQHPHILPLFDSGDADGFLFFVMPYIEGETLRERIDREKQLPVDEAVGIATAVASALSVAHEQGVIHRDIKPGNILLSRGEPLVTDFGIAIAVTKSSGARLTETGLSVGTPYYMSPEQATGDREITAASDVYALGCVLYEMLVGEPPYMGATAQAVLGKILTEKPRRPTAVRAVVPTNVEGAVLQALEKLPADRFRSASGFVRAITDTSFRYGVDSAAAAESTSAAPGPWKRATLALAGLSVILLGGMLWSAVAARSARPPPIVFGLEMPEVERVADIAISPDGSMFAISATSGGARQLWIRRADEADFRPVPGTEGATDVAFSPDGAWLLFRHIERNALIKVALDGSGTIPILESDSIGPFNPHWGVDGTIVFRGAGGTWRIAETGEGGAHHLSDIGGRNVRVLPDGSGALVDDGDNVYLIDFETDSARLLLRNAHSPVYVETGHILYLPPAEAGLFAVPFDLGRHEVTGPPTPVLTGVAANVRTFYDVSSGGTLVYHQGPAAQRVLQRRFLFLDRSGRADTVRLTPRPIWSASLSPDGRYIAYQTDVGGRRDQVQVLDLLTGSTPEVTTEGESTRPIWSPDGTRLAVSGRREGEAGDGDLIVVTLDGGAAERRLLTLPGFQSPVAWSAQDEIVFNDDSGDGDLRIISLEEGAEPRTYLEADYYEGRLAISPDGTLAAYESEETGIVEIFVRGYPDPVGKWNVSLGEGWRPRWSPDGDELYFLRTTQGPDSIFAVPVERDPDFVPGAPTFLFAHDGSLNAFDVHPDGRFLVTENVTQPEADGGPAPEPRWLVVLNWFTTLEERLGR